MLDAVENCQGNSRSRSRKIAWIVLQFPYGKCRLAALLLLGCLLVTFLGCPGNHNNSPKTTGNGSESNSPNTSGSESDATQREASRSEPQSRLLDGAWGIVSIKINGIPRIMPRASYLYVFEGQNLKFGHIGNLTSVPVRFDVNHEPPEFETGIHEQIDRNIYRLNGDKLTICTAKSPLPRPTEFKTVNGDGRQLLVLRRLYIDKLDTPVSDIEFQALIKDIEESAAAGDPVGINTKYDIEGILERATQGFGISENKRLSFIYGLKQGSMLFDLDGGIGSQITDATTAGGRYDFLRSTSLPDDRHAMFRLSKSNGDVEYHDLLIDRDCFGVAKVVDFKNVVLGEWMSDTLKRNITPNIAMMSPDFLDSATETEKIIVESRAEIRQFLLHCMEGRIDDAISIYKHLKPPIQKNKAILFALLQIAVEKNQKVDFLFQQYLKYYSDNSVLGYLFFNHYLDTGDYLKAHQVIDALDECVGGDPYLNTLHAKVFLAAGKLGAAETAVKRTLNAMQTLPAPYRVMVSISLSKKDFEETVRMLKILQANFNLQIDELDKLENYNEFIESKAYSQWEGSSRPSSDRKEKQ